MTEHENAVTPKALLIGGMMELEKAVGVRLRAFGIDLEWHWTMNSKNESEDEFEFPKGCSLVVIVPEMVMNFTPAHSKLIKSWAKTEKIPVVETTGMLTGLDAALREFGFEQKALLNISLPTEPKWTPIPKDSQQPATGKKPSLPDWIVEALVSDSPVDLTPEREAKVLEISKYRRLRLLVNMTPELVDRWMDEETGKNNRNRKAGYRHVQNLGLDFLNGEYILTPFGVIIGRDGVLFDGQHRMYALQASRVTVAMYVYFGEPPEVLKVLDNKRRNRQPHECARIYTGDKNAKSKLEIANTIYYLITKKTFFTPSWMEGWEYVKHFKADVEWASSLPYRKGFSSASIRGALAFAHKTNPSKVEEFAEKVLEGTGLEAGDPALALRKFLLQDHSNASGARRVTAVKALRACQAHIFGESLPRIQATEDSVRFFAEAHGLDLKAGPYKVAKPEDYLGKGKTQLPLLSKSHKQSSMKGAEA